MDGGFVMVIEDDRDVREALVEILESEGFETVSAVNGQDALRLLRELTRLPDLILLDLMMPVMDGWTFSKRQAADPLLSKIPVVAMTAGGMEMQRERLWRSVLQKPMSADRLLRLVQSYCLH